MFTYHVSLKFIIAYINHVIFFLFSAVLDVLIFICILLMLILKLIAITGKQFHITVKK